MLQRENRELRHYCGTAAAILRSNVVEQEAVMRKLFSDQYKHLDVCFPCNVSSCSILLIRVFVFQELSHLRARVPALAGEQPLLTDPVRCRCGMQYWSTVALLDHVISRKPPAGTPIEPGHCAVDARDIRRVRERVIPEAGRQDHAMALAYSEMVSRLDRQDLQVDYEAHRPAASAARRVVNIGGDDEDVDDVDMDDVGSSVSHLASVASVAPSTATSVISSSSWTVPMVVLLTFIPFYIRYFTYSFCV
jgi:hypothetical protein